MINFFRNRNNKNAQKAVEETLADYKAPIDNAREFPFSLSSYHVSKIWGSETWLDLNSNYAFKMITMKKGCQSSLQYHDYKTEANFVIKGKCKVQIEVNGEMQEHIFSAGEGWIVPPKAKHRVIAIANYTALEVSSPHLNDVIRIEDDANRPSGKIEEEHKSDSPR